MSDDFIVGKRRRAIEDKIVARFEKVNFKQDNHAYLDDEDFWDFVFSWYDLVKYYDSVPDTAIGAHILDLYKQCVRVFRGVAQDSRLHERQRDKAVDAVRQMTYYVDRMLRQAERNGIEREAEKKREVGNLDWASQSDSEDDDTPTMSMN